jgi:glycerophosphoryl diester phosphodiesterase
MSGLDWLTARPIAHRGLHNPDAHIIENTASAMSAAISHGYGIEVDVQLTADGEAMVHHDDVLGRLTEGAGRLAAMTAADLKRVRFIATSDRMMTLGDLCDLVAGRTTLVVEMKSALDGDVRIARRTAQVLSGYAGPVAAMSFDPYLVTALKTAAPQIVRGVTAMGQYDDAEWAPLSAWQKWAWPYVPSLIERPHFIAYALRDLPALAPSFAHGALGIPVLAWVARNADDVQYAARFADQIIFEGFQP